SQLPPLHCSARTKPVGVSMRTLPQPTGPALGSVSSDSMSGDFDSQLDEPHWDEAEQFWRREVEELASLSGQTGEWHSAWPRFFGDGVTPMPREDRPVCDGRDWTQDRAFYIWEFNLNEGEARISAEVQDAATLYDDGGHWLDEGSPRNRV